MTFNPKTWYPIAVGLSVLNVVAVAFASTPPHTTAHAVLALGFGLWAQRLRQARRADSNELQARVESIEAELSKLGPLEDELGRLRQELGEAQERLDFAERLMAQREPNRIGREP
jgi:hypothetical protein